MDIQLDCRSEIILARLGRVIWGSSCCWVKNGPLVWQFSRDASILRGTIYQIIPRRMKTPISTRTAVPRVATVRKASLGDRSMARLRRFGLPDGGRLLGRGRRRGRHLLSDVLLNSL